MIHKELLEEWLQKPLIKNRYLIPWDFEKECNIDPQKAEATFKWAVEAGILCPIYQIYCPECEDLLDEINSLDDEDEEFYCFNDHETTLLEVKKTPWKIKSFYRLSKAAFRKQQDGGLYHVQKNEPKQS